MALIEVQADFKRVAAALERIAAILESYLLLSDPAARRLAQAARNPNPPKRTREEEARLFRANSDEELWQKEMDEEAAHLSSQGLPSVQPEK